MGRIFLTSDLHFCHDREFLYKPRGFENVWDMNKAIITNWNSVVDWDDDVYVLGDMMLNDDETGMWCLKQLKGRIHIVLGNHDTDNRIERYKNCYNVVEVENAIRITYKKYHFFMTHYPCFTGNLEKESLRGCVINFYGHTHQKSNFYNDMPFMYHVGVDSHNCTPVLIDDAIEEMKAKVEECKQML